MLFIHITYIYILYGLGPEEAQGDMHNTNTEF